jgi:hypothetical protein
LWAAVQWHAEAVSLRRLFVGSGQTTCGGDESHARLSISPIGQCFSSPYSPTLVAAQKACERKVYTMFSRTHVNMRFILLVIYNYRWHLHGYSADGWSHIQQCFTCSSSLARFLYSANIEENACLKAATLESGGEDLPKAYRSCPVMPAHYR